MASTNEPATPTWLREIVELHEFFERWLGGDAGRGAAETSGDATANETPDVPMPRLEGALGPDFTMVTPSGKVVGREALLSGLAAARGSRPGLRIEILDPSLVAETPTLTVARYTEVQHAEGSTTRRLSSVVFERSEGAPNGLRWLHVHESWV